MENKIHIEFTSIEKGTINFKIFNNNNAFKGYFIQDLDPLKDFISWLEKILTDKETYFMFNPEGEEIIFSTDKKNIFRIKQSSDNKILFEETINRGDFVSDFYNTYVDFFSSEYYQENKTMWEGKTVGKYLAEHFNSPIESVEHKLASSSKQDLETLKNKLNLNLPIPKNWEEVEGEEKLKLIKNYTGKIGASNPLKYKSRRIETFLLYNF